MLRVEQLFLEIDALLEQLLIVDDRWEELLVVGVDVAEKCVDVIVNFVVNFNLNIKFNLLLNFLLVVANLLVESHNVLACVDIIAWMNNFRYFLDQTHAGGVVKLNKITQN